MVGGGGGAICYAPGCRNRNGCSSHISFFRLPSDLERRKKWIEILKIEPKDISKVTDPKICSDHFKGSQFTSRNRVWLKKTAVPFPFKCSSSVTAVNVGIANDQPISNSPILLPNIPGRTVELKKRLPTASSRKSVPSKRIIQTPKSITPTPSSSGIEPPRNSGKVEESSRPRLRSEESQIGPPQRNNPIATQQTQSNQWILLGTNGQFTAYLPQVEVPIATNSQIETPTTSISKVSTIPFNHNQDIDNVTYYLSSFPSSTLTLVPNSASENAIQLQTPDLANLCLMCNTNSLSEQASKEAYLLGSTQRVIINFVKILNLNMNQEFMVEESIPLCLNCLRQAKLLVNAHDELLDLQERFEKLKADILSTLMTSFCQRKAMEEQETVGGFYQDSTIRSEMVNKLLESVSKNSWDSTVRLNTEYVPNLEERMGDPPITKNIEKPADFAGIDDFEDHNFETSFGVDNVLMEPGPEPAVEICFNGKAGTHRMKKKWEALSSCAETAPGLEKLLPFHLRRVTCPICQEKVPPLRISHHLATHPAEERKGVTGLKKFISDSTEIVKGKMRRRIITAKWRALVKSSDLKDGMDSHIPIQCRRVNCPICNKEIGLSYLASHLNTHTGEKPYKCSQCPKSFGGKSNLVSHRSVHLKKAPFRFNLYFCDFCEKGRKFQFRSNYVKHILKAHASIVGATDKLYFYNCDLDGCVESYRDRDQFLQHLTSHNEDGVTFACPYLGCPKIFASSLNCETHLTELHGYCENDAESESTFFDCKYCPKVCGSEKEWTDHESTHGIDMATEQRTHLCEECGKGFKTKLQLWAHKHNGRVHENTSKVVRNQNPRSRARNRRPKEGEPLKEKSSPNCQFCGKRITSHNSMINHLLDTHTYENKLNCYLCNQDFKKLSCLQSHIRRHLGLPRKTSKEKCVFCGEEFSYIISLREHCVKKHFEEYLADKPFYCPLCWFRFEKQEDLTAHHMKLHEQWKCTVCGKQLLNRMRFEDHTRIHTGEAPFPCHLCPKAFRMRVNLKEHIMRHNGEKPFYCLLCPTKTGFFRKKMLRNHMETVHSIIGENVISFSISETVTLGTGDEQQFEVLEIMDVGVGQ